MSWATVREPKVQHGRQEERMVWAWTDPEILGRVGCAGAVGRPWPHLGQICRVERRRTQVRRGQAVRATEIEVSYAITSAPPDQADAHVLQQVLRGHWGIENKLHYVRDLAWDEDRCQVRSGAAPQTLAAGRNLALALLHQRGCTNVTAALRTNAGRPQRAVDLVLGRKLN
jgi:hypothetical protein